MKQLKIGKQIAKRDYASLYLYISEINSLNLLSVEDEVLLLGKIKNGDRKALEELVVVYLRFVVSVAKRFQNQGLTLPNLIIEGNFGLIKAAEGFDENRGFKFISYAIWYIRQSIIRAIAENTRIARIPLNKIGLISKFNCAFTKLEQYYQQEPCPDEIAGMQEFQTNIVGETLKDQSTYRSSAVLNTKKISGCHCPEIE